MEARGRAIFGGMIYIYLATHAEVAYFLPGLPFPVEHVTCYLSERKS